MIYIKRKKMEKKKDKLNLFFIKSALKYKDNKLNRKKFIYVRPKLTRDSILLSEYRRDNKKTFKL